MSGITYKNNLLFCIDQIIREITIFVYQLHCIAWNVNIKNTIINLRHKEEDELMVLSPQRYRYLCTVVDRLL